MYIKNSKTTLFAKHNITILENPILFIHGFTGNCLTWSTVISKMKRSCIAIDIPGHGKSTFNKGIDHYNFKDWSIDLFLTLKEIGIKEIDVCGYSMGGRLAIAFAAEYPKMVKSLILESTGLGIEDKNKKRNRRKRDDSVALEILDDYVAFINNWEKKEFFKEQKKRNPHDWEIQKKSRLSQDAKQLALSIQNLGLGRMPTFINNFIPQTNFQSIFNQIITYTHIPIMLICTCKIGIVYCYIIIL